MEMMIRILDEKSAGKNVEPMVEEMSATLVMTGQNARRAG
jgi:hypothetical protein